MLKTSIIACTRRLKIRWFKKDSQNVPNNTNNNWQPYGESHAIDAMAMGISFAQPLPQLLFARLLSGVERVAFDLGLNSRHTIGPESIQFQQPLPPEIVMNYQGRTYNAMASNEDDAPANKVTEQLQFLPNSILYRTWRYVSWSWHKKRMESLIRPVIDAISETVLINSLRLEYLDRFHQKSNAAPDTRTLIKQSCPYVSPYAFDATDMWHCHTGSFIEKNTRWKRLKLVNIDVIDEAPTPPESIPVRWTNITTALEDRFEIRRIEDYSITSTYVLDTLDVLHDQLKLILAEIITDNIAKRIYLTQ